MRAIKLTINSVYERVYAEVSVYEKKTRSLKNELNLEYYGRADVIFKTILRQMKRNYTKLFNLNS
jgi:hypothetical protein